MSKANKIRDGINSILSEDARDTILHLFSAADEFQQTLLFAAGRYPKLVDFMVRLKGAQAVVNFVDILIGGREHECGTTKKEPLVVPPLVSPQPEPPCDPPPQP